MLLKENKNAIIEAILKYIREGNEIELANFVKLLKDPVYLGKEVYQDSDIQGLFKEVKEETKEAFENLLVKSIEDGNPIDIENMIKIMKNPNYLGEDVYLDCDIKKIFCKRKNEIKKAFEEGVESNSGNTSCLVSLINFMKDNKYLGKDAYQDYEIREIISKKKKEIWNGFNVALKEIIEMGVVWQAKCLIENMKDLINFVEERNCNDEIKKIFVTRKKEMKKAIEAGMVASISNDDTVGSV